MDSRVGPELDPHTGCGYNDGVSTEPFNPDLQCGTKPVVVHFMFNSPDENGYYPGGLACDKHRSVIPPELVLRFHPVGLFCMDPDSIWDYELNECIMPLEALELMLLGTTDLGKDIDEEFERDPERFRGEMAS